MLCEEISMFHLQITMGKLAQEKPAGEDRISFLLIKVGRPVGYQWLGGVLRM